MPPRDFDSQSLGQQAQADFDAQARNEEAPQDPQDLQRNTEKKGPTLIKGGYFWSLASFCISFKRSCTLPVGEDAEAAG